MEQGNQERDKEYRSWFDELLREHEQRGLKQGLAQGRKQRLTQKREQGLTQGGEQAMVQGLRTAIVALAQTRELLLTSVGFGRLEACYQVDQLKTRLTYVGTTTDGVIDLRVLRRRLCSVSTPTQNPQKPMRYILRAACTWTDGTFESTQSGYPSVSPRKHGVSQCRLLNIAP